jgi:hypothetical protein
MGLAPRNGATNVCAVKGGENTSGEGITSGANTGGMTITTEN